MATTLSMMQGDPAVQQAHASAQAVHAAVQAQAAHAAQQAQAQAQAGAQAAQAHADAMRRRSSSGVHPGVGVLGIMPSPATQHANVCLSPVATITPITAEPPMRPQSQQPQQPQQPQLDLVTLWSQNVQAAPPPMIEQPQANGQAQEYWDVRMMQGFPVPGQQQQQQQQRSARRPSQLEAPMEKPRPPQAQAPAPATPIHTSAHSHASGNAQHTRANEPDNVKPFLDGLSAASENPTQRQMWLELVRLQIKTLEHQIAEARARERTAELELHRLKTGVAAISPAEPFSQNPLTHASVPPPTLAQPAPPPPPNVAPLPTQFPAFTSPVIDTLHPFSDNMLASMSLHLPGQGHARSGNGTATPQVTAFDLEAIAQGSNFDNLFSWLPDENGNFMNSAAAPDLGGFGGMMDMSSGGNSAVPTTPLSPTVKRPLSPDDDDESPNAPPPKKGKSRGEKKIVIEQHGLCQLCAKSVARVLLRAPKTSIPTSIAVEFRCNACAHVSQPTGTDPHGAAGSSIGSTEARKRMRTAMEDDDIVNEESGNRRCFCDVCQRVVAVGQVIGGSDRAPLGSMAEIICASCDSKYQRCTDCGGGGGPRVGIGKWRLKQVFQPGRKTCSLSHSRLGDRPREIGVHVTPTDFTPEQLKEVISRCKALWTEKTLSRLAVPEMLEIDLPEGLVNPLRNYSDVDAIVNRCWPSREAMIRADGIDRNRFKRLLGLTWAHSRPRRTVRTVDIEEEYARNADGNDDSNKTVLANVKRTQTVIPAGSELIGMWGCEWDMTHGSLLVSTLISFEGQDGEDTSALSVGELITKVQQLHLQLNTDRMNEARRLGKEAELVRQCEHLWVVSGGSMPLIRERMADILVRKRSFVHVEEYLTRHPDFLEALKARPVGLHPDIHRPMPHQVADGMVHPPQPLILVRWLGKDFNAQRILEIKQKEFGGGKPKGAKVKKMTKAK